jgi:hypothetical protein
VARSSSDGNRLGSRLCLCREHQAATGGHLGDVAAGTTRDTLADDRKLEQPGIQLTIPPRENRWSDRVVARALFTCDPVADRYRCPAGHPLSRQGSSPKGRGACACTAVCRGEAQARTITRPNDGGLAERVRAHLRTRQAKRSLRRRLSWAETPMAELKERHGLRRAQYRGRDQVLMQALGAAMAYNIKKLVRARRPQPQPIALACRPCSGPPACARAPIVRPAHRPRHLADTRRRPARRALRRPQGMTVAWMRRPLAH